MVLKKLRFSQTSLLFILFLNLQIASVAQDEVITFDSVFTKVFNVELVPVKNASLLKSKKPIIFVSTSHCSGCVKYFAQGQKYYQFIFLMNSESLLEVQRIINLYKLKGKNTYFTTMKYLKDRKNTFYNGPTPVAIYNCNNQIHLLYYASLNSASNEFTLNHKLLIDNLNRCKK